MRFTLFTAAVLAAGCAQDLGLDARFFACTVQSDCPDEYSCQNEVCRKAGDGFDTPKGCAGDFDCGDLSCGERGFCFDGQCTTVADPEFECCEGAVFVDFSGNDGNMALDGGWSELDEGQNNVTAPALHVPKLPDAAAASATLSYTLPPNGADVVYMLYLAMEPDDTLTVDGDHFAAPVVYTGDQTGWFEDEVTLLGDGKDKAATTIHWTFETSGVANAAAPAVLLDNISILPICD